MDHARRFSLSPLVVATFGAALSLVACSSGGHAPDSGDPDPAPQIRDGGSEAPDGDGNETAESATQLRVATFNTSLSRETQGRLTDDLEGGDDEQARQAAEILQRLRPDVVLLNEFDRDEQGEAAELFVDAYLAVGQDGAEPLEMPHRYLPPTNTGVHSGADLNNDDGVVSTPGSQAYGDDAFGFGLYSGHYGMLVLSRHPIVDDEIRSFRKLRWASMPESLMPTDWYSEEAAEVMRLSSKNHVDVPVEVGGGVVHLLASHPTPPSFDGPENRNERRNHDEIRFWRDYLSPDGDAEAYIEDDDGTAGGLGDGERFVVVGDLNNDPHDSDGRPAAIRRLLEHARVQDPEPTSEGAVEAAESDGGANTSHEGDPALDTADFEDRQVGNLRMDYALPSADLTVDEAGVWWPTDDAEHADLLDASDHRPVWVDVTVEDPP